MRSLLAILFVLVPPAIASAEIHKWVDEDGLVHYSDRKPGNEAVAEVELEIEANTYQGVSYGMSTIETKKVAPRARVVMLSASWCGICKTAKAYFRRNGVRFTEFDIEKSARGRKLYQQLGATSVPVILVGDKRMNGFTEAGFERLVR